MKSITFLTLAILLSFGVTAQDFKGATITVTIDNVLSDQGEILAALHTDATFLKGPGVQSFKTGATEGTLTFTFEDVAPGTYAISVMQDLNGNQRMDFQSNGMPVEPYGMSGNDMAMGPPTFGRSAFEVTWDDLDLNIRF